MIVRKAGYDNMGWLDALKASKKPKGDDLGSQNEAEIENALESTASVAFGLPTKEETSKEAIARSSREIADKMAEDDKMAAANEVRAKLSDNGIDPVALGVQIAGADGKYHKISKEEWESISDARFANRIAVAAALEFEKMQRQAWQKDVVRPAQKLSSSFDPKTASSSRVVSSAGPNEETTMRDSRLPANAASILDPDRLHRFAEQETEHDRSVAASRKAQKDRENERKASLAPDEKTIMADPMHSGRIVASAGVDRDVYMSKTPRNQVSMMDTMGEKKLTGDELKAAMSSLFSRIEDNATPMREANKDRQEKIQGKKEKDRSWEKAAKPLSTADLTKALMERWMPPSPGR